MKPSEKMRRRLIQIAAFGFSNTHAGNLLTGRIYTGRWKEFCNPGLHCYSCPAAGLSCPVGAMQAVASSREFSWSFYVTGFVLAVGALLGRWVCAYLCPFGLMQELLHKIPSRKRRLPGWTKYIKYAVLTVFVWLLPAAVADYTGLGSPAFCKYICPSGTLFGAWPLLFAREELRGAVGGLFALKCAVLLIVLTGSVFVFRFFCKTLCPLGAVYGILNKVSLLRVRVDTERCVGCGKCARSCRMDVDPVKTPDSAECIRCGECVSACPEGAIVIGFGSLLNPDPDKT